MHQHCLKIIVTCEKQNFRQKRQFYLRGSAHAPTFFPAWVTIVITRFKLKLLFLRSAQHGRSYRLGHSFLMNCRWWGWGWRVWVVGGGRSGVRWGRVGWGRSPLAGQGLGGFQIWNFKFEFSNFKFEISNLNFQIWIFGKGGWSREISYCIAWEGGWSHQTSYFSAWEGADRMKYCILSIGRGGRSFFEALKTQMPYGIGSKHHRKVASLRLSKRRYYVGLAQNCHR